MRGVIKPAIDMVICAIMLQGAEELYKRSQDDRGLVVLSVMLVVATFFDVYFIHKDLSKNNNN